MADPGGWRSAPRPKNSGLRRAWCCPFGAAHRSPDRRSSPHYHHHEPPSKPPQKPPPFAGGSFHGSPSPSNKLGLGIIDPRRILSPGRVSPIDSDAPLGQLPEIADAASIANAAVESEPESSDPLPKERSLVPERPVAENGAGLKEGSLDLRLSLKGKDGRCLVWELDSEVLCESSAFFASMVLNSGQNVSDALADCRKIEVTGVEDLGVFGETIELMYEKDATRWLMKAGISRAIDVLEVSSTIMFDRGITSCLKYIEAVPWSEKDEEKLKSLFARYTFDEAISQDVLARLFPRGPNQSEVLALQLIRSVANGTNSNARKEMQFFVSGLLSKSSVYQKDPAGLNKESLYSICQSCLNSLVELFEEASNSGPVNQMAITKATKPLIERVSKQVENINWLLEILVDKQMAEDFVCLWARQDGLIRMHGMASPMVRYELSRISASLFIALGRGRLQCGGNMRSSVLRAWFGPMLVDFGWLQRCSKGLDMRMLEESLGQALLTLPLKQQQSFFEEWFRCFVCHGTECPNLGKAFQVWWRRSFAVRSSEAHSHAS
ncbi:BTB/POZ domain-containing protein At2g13690-like [Phoenix dactylifera]|uniref:BTB/POZ domain-containing protein At2g13690-like n=1 Tax=Phoenix dactylifera TaxID=42345 RepID=A0A8B9AC24_PHODC|nr:BTB/POZ domain-containing protein At2g13690-like [Phoenix dactylifera]